VVFIGDSITHGWERPSATPEWSRYFGSGEYKALNLGYGADRTEHVLWRIDNGELDGYKARVVVLMIGTNNTGHFPADKETPIDTILGVKEILGRIAAKQPDAVTLLLPIFPRGRTPDDPCRRRNDIVNKELKHFADGRKVVWVDFTDRFLAPDGTLSPELMPDYLHFGGGNSRDGGAEGFNIWAAGIIPYIDTVLSRDPGDRRVIPNLYPAHAEPWRGGGTPLAATPYTRINAYSSSRGEQWWIRRLRQKRDEVASSGGKYDLVMLGDSITHFWEVSTGCRVYATVTNRYSTLNLGYGGDNTRHALWRSLNGELDGYSAKCVMLMIGTNNGDNPEDTAAGIRRILDVIAVKQPSAKTLLLPIFPRDLYWKGTSGARKRNEAVNALIKDFADGDKVRWLDIYGKFLADDGSVSKDLFCEGLHLNHNGYTVWRDAVAGAVAEICGK
jgi:lysophospholipase L1-like esterase